MAGYPQCHCLGQRLNGEGKLLPLLRASPSTDIPSALVSLAKVKSWVEESEESSVAVRSTPALPRHSVRAPRNTLPSALQPPAQILNLITWWFDL